MSIATEVWIACDQCDERIGPCLTETTALLIAIRAKWMPLKATRHGREVSLHWCPACRSAMPPT